MSAVKEERYWAEARDRALSDEGTMLNAARREGDQTARHQTLRQQRGGQVMLQKVARNHRSREVLAEECSRAVSASSSSPRARCLLAARARRPPKGHLRHG
jgi:hypothetical protein